jgi:hypothetical protein
VQLDTDCEILDARILRASRPVIKFAKGDVAESKKNSLPLSFAILEKGDGAALQITYAGRSDASISIKGTITGAGGLREAVDSHNAFAETREQKIRTVKATGYFALVFSILSIVAAGVFLLHYRRLALDDPRRRSIWAVSLVLALSAFLLVLSSCVIHSANAANASPVPSSILRQD